MMGLSSCSIVNLKLVLRFLLINVFVANYMCIAFLQQPSCHDEERSALLQLKDSFVINKYASGFEGAYPKILEWNSSTSNCCLWDGIYCDAESGHVIGLDLGSNCLFGSINSGSPLFCLVHLQMLDLSDNHFNFSQIPSAVGQLSGLTYLNLSRSAFYGQVPLEITNLTRLTSLDICCNSDPNTGEKLLHLNIPNLEMLVQNLSSLETLVLSHVYISSKVPDLLTNFTSLTMLALKNCELYGEFPAKIFQLPNLQFLSVRFNKNLTGRLPNFQQRSPLVELRLQQTNFFGSLPYSIDKLDSLEILDVTDCNISGHIPSSLGKLSRLTDLYLGYNNFNGKIPSSIQNLTHLETLALGQNQISGPILPLRNLTKLKILDLSENLVHGIVPESFSMLVNLEILYLNGNGLEGNLNFDMFFNMKNLTKLQLGFNNFSSLIFGKTNRNATVSKFTQLDMSSCNLRKFPNFLRHQNELEWLSLQRNEISGQVPKWMGNTSVDTLAVLYLHDNFLTGFDLLAAVLPWVNLRVLEIPNNMLQGPLPFPPPTIVEYDASYNMLSGEIPPNFFCNMSNLQSLDLSNNHLGSTVPQFLANSTSSLKILSFRNNSLRGIIPQICSNNATSLRMIDLSYNQLQGLLPRSLCNCVMLECIVISNNQLHDSFPQWLGSLPELKILMLHQNGFYGTIEKPKKDSHFSNLRVLDLSSNSFIGQLPFQYLFTLNAMKYSIKSISLKYVGSRWENMISNFYITVIDETYGITIMYKGVAIHFIKIQDVFAFVDLSDNRFEGEISDLFGGLKALHSLNLSNNMLTGCIPLSLGNLSEIESLDLSRNKLSCQIPQQLLQLGFLSSFNVSHNNLTGSIPQGKQFDTFDSSSFDGNPGLCGDPLPKKCGSSPSLPPPLEEDDKDLKSLLKENWIFILAGFISGLVVGVVLADIAMKTTHGWLLVEMLSESKKRKGKMKMGRRT